MKNQQTSFWCNAVMKLKWLKSIAIDTFAFRLIPQNRITFYLSVWEKCWTVSYTVTSALAAIIRNKIKKLPWPIWVCMWEFSSMMVFHGLRTRIESRTNKCADVLFAIAIFYHFSTTNFWPPQSPIRVSLTDTSKNIELFGCVW